MAEASIRARIAADGQPFLATLKSTEQAAQAWGARMAQTTAKAAGGGGRGASVALLELSRAVEDAQYGIRGVLNNIPGLAMALGGGAGLAGAASLAAVAVATLGKAFYDFTTNAKGIKEATDDLAKMDQKLQQAMGKSAAESIRGTVEAATALKDAIALADKEFADSSAMLAATHEDEEERIRAEMELRLHWLAKVEEAHGKAAIAEIKAKEDLAKVQEGTRRADEAEVERLEELARLRERLNQIKGQSAAQTPIEFAAGGGPLPDPEIARLEALIKAEEAVGPRDRTRDILAANKALAASVDATEAAVVAEKARATVERERVIGIGKIGEARKKAAEEAAKVQKEADEGEDVFRREHIRQQKEQDALEEKQLDRVIQLQRAYDKEADALRKINDEHKEALGHIEKEARIKGLRDQGRNTQADREERAMRISERTTELEGMGASPERARRIAEQENRRPGRIDAGSRQSELSVDDQIRGAFSNLASLPRRRRHRQAGGIDEITESPRSSGTDQRRMERHLERIEKHLSGKRDDKGDPVRREH